MCSIYYETKGRFCCLYRHSGGSITTFFMYHNHRYMALLMRRVLHLRIQILQGPPKTNNVRSIASYFPELDSKGP
jgi:hypothetical protein